MHFNILSATVCLVGLVTANPTAAAPDKTLSARAGTISNPVIYQDFPDLDLFRVGSVYYYSSSTFAFSPGAPLLKSYDLINWAPVTHSVPYLNFGSQYNLTNGQRAYESGIWASTVRYRNSTDTWYWYGCIGFSTTYIWTAKGTGAGSNGGDVPDSSWNWQPAGTISTCFYDCGLLIDDNDTMYIAYGSPKISVSQLSSDGLSIVKTEQVWTQSSSLEGSRMYKVNGNYYIFNDIPANAETVLKASSPFGPYTQQTLFSNVNGPISNAGYAHQGGMVETADGSFYFFAFMDSYPGGRIPVAAPMTFGSNGWPTVQLSSGNTWPSSVAAPNIQTSKTVPSLLGTDYFNGTKLSPEWEFNHNPDTTKFHLASGGGLVLQTATVTNDLFSARNTLTHRIMGPTSTGTFQIDISSMANGDRAGAALFRDNMAYIGVWKTSAGAQIVMVNNLIISGSGWPTTASGSTAATGPTLSSNQTTIWLRVSANITPGFSGTNAARQTTFSYSTDGSKFTSLGPAFTESESYTFFTGYRYGVFNFATSALGGSVTVKSFTMAKD